MGTTQLLAIYLIFIFLDFGKILFGNIHCLVYFQGENRNNFIFTGKSESKGIRHLKVWSSEVARGLPRGKAQSLVRTLLVTNDKNLT